MKPASRWKIIACFAVVSLASAFIGAAITWRWARQQPPPPGAVQSASADVNDLYVSHLKTYLSLTDEQTARVGAISRKARADVQSKAGEPGAFTEARRRMQTDIRAVLNDEQGARFERLNVLRQRVWGGTNDSRAATAKPSMPPDPTGKRSSP